MAAAERSPTSRTLVAAIAGAVAWTVPIVILPFVSLIPGLPEYRPSPYVVQLAASAISFSIGAFIGAGLLLIGISLLPLSRKDRPRHTIRLRTVLPVLVGSALGGAVAALFGAGVGYSRRAQSLLLWLGWLDRIPEPFLSLGYAIGAALSAAIILPSSSLESSAIQRRRPPTRVVTRVVVRTFGIAIACRALFLLIQFSSFVRYSEFGESFWFYLVNLTLTASLFGAWAWRSYSKSLRAAFT